MKQLEELLQLSEYKERTKDEYRKTFRKITKTFNTEDFKNLFTDDYDNTISELCKIHPSNNNHWYRINTFCKHYNIKYIDPPKTTSKTKVVQEFNIHNMRHIIKGIEKNKRNLQAIMFLSLLTNNCKVALRRDWGTVKIKEHCTDEQIEQSKSLYSVLTGEFQFTELNKTYRSLTFTVNDSLKDIISEYTKTIPDSQYLYVYKASSDSEDARIDSFSHYISRISTTYLKRRMAMTDFRDAMVQGDTADTLNNPDLSPSEKIEELALNAIKKDHTQEAEAKYYLASHDSSRRNVYTQTDQVTSSITEKDSVFMLISLGYTVKLN